mmetsp:Transcript_20774/g.30157  ORF Transcript_20774/g.30157 Transcript_20774/m.30157 type:complete len:90 (-) Transcript_20774:383-652(-)
MAVMTVIRAARATGTILAMMMAVAVLLQDGSFSSCLVVLQLLGWLAFFSFTRDADASTEAFREAPVTWKATTTKFMSDRQRRAHDYIHC